MPYGARSDDTDMLIRQRLATLTIAAAAIAACAASSLRASPVPIEIWRGGDDGLTVRLRDAIEAAFRAAEDFSLSSGNSPGTLIVTVPSNVAWRRIGERAEIVYLVRFSDGASRSLGTRTGTCGEDQLRECAAQVLAGARVAAANLRQP